MGRGSMAQAMCRLAAIMLLRNTLVIVNFETPLVGCQIGAKTASLDENCCNFARFWITTAAAQKTLAEKPPALHKDHLPGSSSLLQLQMALKWTDASDQQLRDAVAQAGGAPKSVSGGGAWESIAARVPGRTAGACAQRWYNQLKPGLVTGPSTAVEDTTTMLVTSLFGTSWAELAPVLHRGPAILKDRWNKDIKMAAKQLQLTLKPGEAVSAKTVARVLQVLHGGAASYDAAVVENAIKELGAAAFLRVAEVSNGVALAKAVGTALAALPPAAPVPRTSDEAPCANCGGRPRDGVEFERFASSGKRHKTCTTCKADRAAKKPAPVGVPRPRPRGRAPKNQSGEPATWDASAGRWLDVAPMKPAAPKKPKKPKKPAPVGVPRPRGNAPRNRSGEPATWDAVAGRWLAMEQTEQAPPRLAAQVAAATSQALALAVPYIFEALPTSKLAVTCSSIKQLVNWSIEAAMRKYKMRNYPSCQATMRLARAGISGRSLHAPSTCLRAGGTGLIVASAGSRVSGVGAECVLRMDEMSVDFERALFDINYEVGYLFGNAERFPVAPDELFGETAELLAGLGRLGWQNPGTDRGHQLSRHAELVDVEGAADRQRHGRRACSATMLDGLVLLADGIETERCLYPLSGKWESTVHAHNRTILTPPGSKRVTHSAHRDCSHCPHTRITRMPLVVLVFVRYYTLDDNGMLRRASPDLARVSGLRFRELRRGAGPDFFAQIADGGFVMFDAHANAHFTHEVMRADDPAEGIYRISIVVHLMSLPKQREGAA